MFKMKDNQIRALLFLVFVVSFLSLMAVGSVTVLTPEKADIMRGINEAIANTPTFLGLFWEIFSNNVVVGLLSAVPFFYGVIHTVVVAYNTGLILSAVSTAQTTGFQVFLFILSVPTTWMEVTAYSLVVAESTFFTWKMLKAIRFEDFKTNVLKESKFYLKIVTISLGIIIFSALVETLIIRG